MSGGVNRRKKRSSRRDSCVLTISRRRVNPPPRPSVSMRSLANRTCDCLRQKSTRQIRFLHAAALSSPVASTSSLDWRSAPGTASNSPEQEPRKRQGKKTERWAGWTPVIGLELHVQLKGNLKLFSDAKAVYDDVPNTHVAFFDAALPGSLPMLQREPVRLALLASLALKSTVNRKSTFDRKHYFYVDLPAGFQITQKYSPLATGGKVHVRHDVKGKSRDFEVRIDQIQLEQDTAKSSHDPESGSTLVDLNRAGAALIEIVTKPDMRTPEEAAAFVRHLQAILRRIGASDANMERGELRCDVNVSVHRTPSTIGPSPSVFGSRCEIKNLNGVRFLVGAIESEIARQIAALSQDPPGEIVQATRGYDVVTGETFHLRSKEDAPDYRYMPDPQLGAVVVTREQLEELQVSLPKLPDELIDSLMNEHGLLKRDSTILVGLVEDGRVAHWFESIVLGPGDDASGRKKRDAKMVANWLIHELPGQLAKAGIELTDSPIELQDLGRLIDAVQDGLITGTSAKAVLANFLSNERSSGDTVSFETLLRSSISSAPQSSRSATGANASPYREICTAIIKDMPEEAAKVRAGQGKVVMRLVGEAMKRSEGRLDAKVVADTFRSLLSS